MPKSKKRVQAQRAKAASAAASATRVPDDDPAAAHRLAELRARGTSLSLLARRASAAAASASQEVDGVTWLEHLNIVVGADAALAEAFYFGGLGLTRDPTQKLKADGSGTIWANCGHWQQFHLALSADEEADPPQVLPGAIGLALPSLRSALARLQAPRLAAQLRGTRFAVTAVEVERRQREVAAAAAEEEAEPELAFVAATCPWGNTFYLYDAAAAAQPATAGAVGEGERAARTADPRRMVQAHAGADDTMAVRGGAGIRFVEFPCADAAAVGAFYGDVIGCHVFAPLGEWRPAQLPPPPPPPTPPTAPPTAPTAQAAAGQAEGGTEALFRSMLAQVQAVVDDPPPGSSDADVARAEAMLAKMKADDRFQKHGGVCEGGGAAEAAVAAKAGSAEVVGGGALPPPAATAAVAVCVGPCVHFLFTSRTETAGDAAAATAAAARLAEGAARARGVHACIYIPRFKSVYEALQARGGAVWSNPRFAKTLDSCDTFEDACACRQFRFKSLNFPKFPHAELFELEHETRSLMHNQFLKHVAYEPK